jgi:aminoglycoside phosphotransferase (APT) family kinase protein
MVEFNIREIEAELRAAFPSFNIPSPLSIIGSGFNSIVMEADGTIIFRIGKNSIAQQGYEKEMGCLSILAPNIPFLIPAPKWYIKSAPYFPFGVIGYDKIPGLPLQPDPRKNVNLLARDTARFLFALHQVSPESLPFQDTSDSAAKWEIQPQTVLPVLADQLTPAKFSRIEQWWDHFLADPKMQSYNPALQHGDLWYENMLVDAHMEKLIGIIDWEKLSIGDPAQDFATLFHLGENFVRLVIDAYQALGGELDENFEHCMLRLWEAREFDGLQHAIKFDDTVELKDALQKLRQGPILKRPFQKGEK